MPDLDGSSMPPIAPRSTLHQVPSTAGYAALRDGRHPATMGHEQSRRIKNARYDSKRAKLRHLDRPSHAWSVTTRYRDVGYDSDRWNGFQFRDDDIVISAPAKCGTTWLQRVIALLIFDTPDLPNYLTRVSPWLDMQTLALDEVLQELQAQSHRRFIKTHTPLAGLPIDPRVSFVTIGRDPRDVALSFLAQYRNVNHEAFMKQREAAVGLDDLGDFGGGPRPAANDLQSILAHWINFSGGETTWGLVGTVNHLRSFWDRRTEPNVVMVTTTTCNGT